MKLERRRAKVLGEETERRKRENLFSCVTRTSRVYFRLLEL